MTYSAPPDIKDKHFAAFEEGLPSLAGQVIAITGTTSGTGLVAARTCAAKGATVILLNRASERSKASLEKLQAAVPEGKFVPIECDLQSFDSVRSAAAKIKESVDAVNVLANNAGVMALKDVSTVDGFDVQMQTNVISPFLLTKELYPLLEKAAAAGGPARVVMHSSVARLGVSKLEAKYFDKDMAGRLGGDFSLLMMGGPWTRYCQTKQADIAFTCALGDKLAAKGSKVMALACHPGLAATSLQVNTVKEGGMGGCFTSFFMKGLAQSMADGAMGLIRCIADTNVKNRGFYGPGQGLTAMSGKAKDLKMERRYDNDKTKALLWSKCEEAIGEEFQV